MAPPAPATAHMQQQQAAPGSRASDEINGMVQALLRNTSLPLKAEDFDLRARQVLHAIKHKGGQEQVAEALGMVSAFAEKKKVRNAVQNWSAYVGAILRRFLNDFKVQMISGDARDEDYRVNAWEFKSPSATRGAEMLGTPAAESKDIKWWKDVPSNEALAPIGAHPLLSTAPPPTRTPLQPHTWQKESSNSSGSSMDHNTWWKNLLNVPQPSPPQPQTPQPPPPPTAKQNWQSISSSPSVQAISKGAQRWSDTTDGPDAWYSEPWAASWAYHPDGEEFPALGGARSRRKSVSEKSKPETTTARRASFGGYSGAPADTCGSPKRRPRLSLQSPGAEATICETPKRKTRLSMQSPKAQADTCESPKRKQRASLGGRSPSLARKDDMERKPRKSLTGTKWVPKAVPTLASMLQPKLTQKHLERQLASWVKSGRRASSDARVVALCDGETSGHQVASVMLLGNEFRVEMDSPAGSAKHVVIGAWTRSAWPALQHSITSALQSCSGKNFKEFIGALWAALPAPEQGCVDGTIIKEAYVAEAQARHAEESPEQDAALCAVGLEQAQELPHQSCARQFAHWLNDRQPLWRIGASGDQAWDFPLSKAEKREYLFLTTSAECAELREENSDLKASEAALLNEIEFCSLEKEIEEEQ